MACLRHFRSTTSAVRLVAVGMAATVVAASCGGAADESAEPVEPTTTQSSTSSETSETTTTSSVDVDGQIGSAVDETEPEPETDPEKDPDQGNSGTHERSAMVLTEQDLLTFGLSGYSLLYSDPSPQAADAEGFEPGECSVPDVGLHSRIDTEWAGNNGVDPRVVQTVLEGDDLEYWIEAIGNLADCETLPLQLADRGVAGAWDSVVLSPEGTDSDGVSYAMAVAVADDVAVLMIVFADTVDDPVLDPVVLASLTATTLSRRGF